MSRERMQQKINHLSKFSLFYWDTQFMVALCRGDVVNVLHRLKGSPSHPPGGGESNSGLFFWKSLKEATSLKKKLFPPSLACCPSKSSRQGLKTKRDMIQVQNSQDDLTKFFLQVFAQHVVFIWMAF